MIRRVRKTVLAVSGWPLRREKDVAVTKPPPPVPQLRRLAIGVVTSTILCLKTAVRWLTPHHTLTDVSMMSAIATICPAGLLQTMLRNVLTMEYA